MITKILLLSLTLFLHAPSSFGDPYTYIIRGVAPAEAQSLWNKAISGAGGDGRVTGRGNYGCADKALVGYLLNNHPDRGPLAWDNMEMWRHIDGYALEGAWAEEAAKQRGLPNGTVGIQDAISSVPPPSNRGSIATFGVPAGTPITPRPDSFARPNRYVVQIPENARFMGLTPLVDGDLDQHGNIMWPNGATSQIPRPQPAQPGDSMPQPTSPGFGHRMLNCAQGLPRLVPRKVPTLSGTAPFIPAAAEIAAAAGEKVGVPEEVVAPVVVGGAAVGIGLEAYGASGLAAAGVGVGEATSLTASATMATASAAAAPAAAGTAAAAGVAAAGFGGYQAYQHSPSRGYAPANGYSTGWVDNFVDLYSPLWSWW